MTQEAFVTKLSRKETLRLQEEYQRWCERTGQKFPHPIYGTLSNVSVHSGRVSLIFLTDKEFKRINRVARKVILAMGDA